MPWLLTDSSMLMSVAPPRRRSSMQQRRGKPKNRQRDSALHCGDTRRAKRVGHDTYMQLPSFGGSGSVAPPTRCSRAVVRGRAVSQRSSGGRHKQDGGAKEAQKEKNPKQSKVKRGGRTKPYSSASQDASTMLRSGFQPCFRRAPSPRATFGCANKQRQQQQQQQQGPAATSITAKEYIRNHRAKQKETAVRWCYHDHTCSVCTHLEQRRRATGRIYTA